MQVSGVRAQVLTWASCSWQRTWLAARTSHDSATREHGADMVRTFAADPRLSRWDSFQPKYAAAVTADDPGPIETEIKFGCPEPSPVVGR